jgi:hypothetical protein
MTKHNKRLPILSSRSLAMVCIACALLGCGRDQDGLMPPPGKPPRPQAQQTPSAAIQKALFKVPSSSVRYENGQVLIAEHRVIHT